ncbi:MAG: hypothetical protein HYX81_01870 [Chloroflexi bacterium]|nr:hypothetical protein [Chloroflexota bacterium]
MGKRDFVKRETKKPKKDAKKITAEITARPPITVEVIKKGKKLREEEEV